MQWEKHHQAQAGSLFSTMTAESSESSDVDGGDALYRQVEDYPYGQDQDFQVSLRLPRWARAVD